MMTNEKPILFSGEMVRAILDGRKTQTRRVIKPQPIEIEWVGISSNAGKWFATYEPEKHGREYKRVKCLYGKIGDRLWVREACRAVEGRNRSEQIEYRADNLLLPNKINGAAHSNWLELNCYRKEPSLGAYILGENAIGKWVPSIHMPRWASRINLIIKDIRVERVQCISDDNCYDEGIDTESDGCAWSAAENASIAGISVKGGSPERYAFISLWDSINAKRGYGWDVNPYVWVIEFERVKQ